MKLFCELSEELIENTEYVCYNLSCISVSTLVHESLGCNMKISYKRLWVLLIQKDITKVTLKRDVGISAGTMCKLNKGEEVALSVLLRICDYLDCDIGDICEAVKIEGE